MMNATINARESHTCVTRVISRTLEHTNLSAEFFFVFFVVRSKNVGINSEQKQGMLFSIRSSICSSIHHHSTSITQFIHPSTHLSIHPLIYPWPYPSTNPSIYPLIHPSTDQSIHLPIHPSTHSSIHQSIHPSIHWIHPAGGQSRMRRRVHREMPLIKSSAFRWLAFVRIISWVRHLPGHWFTGVWREGGWG